MIDALLGRTRLTIVFWGYCIGGTLAVGAVVMAVLPAVFRVDPWVHDRWLTGLVAGVPFLAYVLWAHVSLWRCAFNVKHRGWGYVARCYAVAVLAYYVTSLAFHSH